MQYSFIYIISICIYALISCSEVKNDKDSILKNKQVKRTFGHKRFLHSNIQRENYNIHYYKELNLFSMEFKDKITKKESENLNSYVELLYDTTGVMRYYRIFSDKEFGKYVEFYGKNGVKVSFRSEIPPDEHGEHAHFITVHDSTQNIIYLHCDDGILDYKNDPLSKNIVILKIGILDTMKEVKDFGRTRNTIPKLDSFLVNRYDYQESASNHMKLYQNRHVVFTRNYFKFDKKSLKITEQKINILPNGEEKIIEEYETSYPYRENCDCKCFSCLEYKTIFYWLLW